MFFVAHYFRVLFSFNFQEDFEFVFVHRALTVFTMPAVITEKSCHISNQSQRMILLEVTCAI